MGLVDRGEMRQFGTKIHDNFSMVVVTHGMMALADDGRIASL